MEVLALKMKNNIKPAGARLRKQEDGKAASGDAQTIVAMENDKYDLTLELAIAGNRAAAGTAAESIFFLDEES